MSTKAKRKTLLTNITRYLWCMDLQLRPIVEESYLGEGELPQIIVAMIIGTRVQLTKWIAEMGSDLFFRWCQIGNAGLKVLVEELKHNTVVEELNLDSNNISDDGAIMIAKLLNENNILKCILL